MISKNYAFISQNNTHIQMRIQSLLETLIKESTEVLKYDCTDTNFLNIYEEMITPSLFYDEKVIVLFTTKNYHIYNQSKSLQKEKVFGKV